MNTYKITFKAASKTVLVSGSRYICDAELLSVIRGEGESESLVASFHNWDTIRLVEND